jgi:hypothetical protein
MDHRDEYRRNLERAEWEAEHARGNSERQAWLTIAASYRALLGYFERPRTPPQSTGQQSSDDNEPQ